MSKTTSRPVWSSETGDQRKTQPAPGRGPASLPPSQQTVALHRESKGRGGKGVTVLRGLRLSDADRAALAAALKQALGVGGTVKGDLIEIQGQERERIAAVLTQLGYKVKLAGG